MIFVVFFYYVLQVVAAATMHLCRVKKKMSRKLFGGTLVPKAEIGIVQNNTRVPFELGLVRASFMRTLEMRISSDVVCGDVIAFKNEFIRIA